MGDLAAERRRGASEILGMGAAVFKALAQGSRAGKATELLAEAAEVGRRLLAAQPAMGPVHHLVDRALRAIGDGSLEERRATLGEVADRFRQEVEESVEAVAREAASLLRGARRIVTYSRSGTVLAALAYLEGNRSPVLLAESRPGLEGRSVAETLAGRGHPVSVAVDAALPALLTEGDAVVLGADAVTADRFCNKIGSRALVEAAGRMGLWTAILADGSKFLPSDRWVEEAGGGPVEEVWGDPPPGVEIINPYFEQVPLALLRYVVTEQGPVIPQAVPDLVMPLRLLGPDDLP